MTENEQRVAAKKFAEFWKDKGYEKGESQSFWLSLLRDVYGVEHPEEFISFEEQVHLDHTSFIDGTIPSTKVMIEQKGLGKNLNKPIRQSDGALLTPFEQAKRYITELPLSKHPRWVVTCNFSTFYVYDMERPGGDPEIIELENLEKEYYRLQFLVNTENEHLKKEMEVSIAAGEIVGLLYDALTKQYADPTSEKSMKSLNVLCVRLVFCLYAEDTGIFGHHGMFHDYLAEFDTRHMRRALTDLFKILDTKPSDRDPYLADDNPLLAAFPYVNGGLFANEDIEIPPFTDEIRDLLLVKASDDFDWSEISPTIFGAVFESTLNPETRRSGGMHYTSIENIHKVIDPLFLDELKKELAEIKEISVERTRKAKLTEFQKKLASLTWLDSSAGSGNFLTETYISIRRLENEVIRELSKGQMSFADENYSPIQVSISQFYGIEINDFAVTVAKTALWIAESQMMKETEEIVMMQLDFLPLKTNAGIVEGNALRMDWEDVVPKDKLNYIMGNPPFVGYAFQKASQKEDLQEISKQIPEIGKNIDYVSGWYFKAAEYIKETDICVAFVSTNSITQGEQVASVWEPLYNHFGIHIDFAYRTFRWDSEASLKAHVHCVIVGFSVMKNNKQRQLYESERVKLVDNINAYLLDGPDIFIKSRKRPICDVPEMVKGSSPVDGGNLLLTDEEKCKLIEKEPESASYIKRFYGAKEYLHNIKRWCIWIERLSPAELNKLPLLKEHISAVRDFRMASSKAATRKFAEYPMRFMEVRQHEKDYILVPRHSSETRRYIPFGFISSDAVCGDANSLIPDATLYHFGILMSNVHMAWTRVVCGRIKSDYRYSNNIVYNNFPWPTPTDAQKTKIEETAQAILDARALYPDSSLADLYDELTMPPELRRAHQNNDRAVMAAYGFTKGTEAYSSESACVAELMKLYRKLVE